MTGDTFMLWSLGAARAAVRRRAWMHVHNLASKRAQPLRQGS